MRELHCIAARLARELPCSLRHQPPSTLSELSARSPGQSPLLAAGESPLARLLGEWRSCYGYMKYRVAWGCLGSTQDSPERHHGRGNQNDTRTKNHAV